MIQRAGTRHATQNTSADRPVNGRHRKPTRTTPRPLPAMDPDPDTVPWSPLGQRVHMIGIGGCGMRGAAALLLKGGAVVSGSDRAANGTLARMKEQGATIHVGQRAANLPEDCDLVVCSAAIKESNPELVAARDRGLRIIRYAELLGLLMSRHAGIAIAGTHGKSTTTAMVSWVLRQAGLDPSFVIGAAVHQLGGSSGVGDGDHFVVEACEFDRSFLNLQPKFATILNLEEDHLDCYANLEAIIESFAAFAANVPADGVLVVNGEDRNAMRAVEGISAAVQTFGFDGEADWKARIIEVHNGCSHFQIIRQDQPIAEMRLRIPGRHMVADALAAFALCRHCGVAPERIADILSDFEGAHRRMTLRGTVAGVTVVDDYGHHPTEIQATLRAAREFYNPRKMFVVFQPHQHSRTRFLLNDFARSFGSADVVIVPDIYFVRDSESERDEIDATDLVERIHLNGGDARHEKSFARIAADLCTEVEEGDLVVTMGAGDVWQVADQLLHCLQTHRTDAGAHLEKLAELDD